MKKIYISICILCCILLSGCKSKLPKDDVTERATEIAEMLNEGKADDVYDLFTDELKEEVESLDFKNSFSSRRLPLENFQKFDEPVVKYEDDMAACFIGAVYDKGMLEFQIVLDKEMNISGLFVR